MSNEQEPQRIEVDMSSQAGRIQLARFIADTAETALLLAFIDFCEQNGHAEPTDVSVKAFNLIRSASTAECYDLLEKTGALVSHLTHAAMSAASETDDGVISQDEILNPAVSLCKQLMADTKLQSDLLAMVNGSFVKPDGWDPMKRKLESLARAGVTKQDVESMVKAMASAQDCGPSQ